MSGGNGCMSIGHDVCRLCHQYREDITWFDRCGGWVWRGKDNN